jgi:ATP-dependent helicase/nuclease subunit A
MSDDLQLTTHGTTEDRRPETDDAELGRPSPGACRQSSFRELKPEQQRAAHTLDRHISVTAGPGAGKTTVLVERYLHILRTQDVGVDQIVAITFTNRAANEMRGRLRRELDRLLLSASPIDRPKWLRHKRTLDGAIINTIHGFCARLLREFPVEADIDPQFALLEAHQSSILEESVVDESLTEFISTNHQVITELAAALGRPRLARGLIDIYRSMRNQGLTISQIADRSISTHKTIEDYTAAIEEVTVKMREFVQLRGLSETVKAKQREINDRWPGLLEVLAASPDSSSPAEICEAIQEFREAARPTAHVRIKELVLPLDELIWEKNLRGRVPQIFFDLYAARYTQDLLEVVKRIEQRLDEEKRRMAALDFDDLQTRALRLLTERPEVLRRTSRRYRFFLVDEFQDTNGLQRDLMAKLVFGEDGGPRASVDADDDGRQRERTSRANLFIVGDRKQSIYGFRGADVDVFREMTERIEAWSGTRIPLSLNFRSQRPLINLFNFLFERVFERDPKLAAEELNELGYVGHEPGIAARDDEDPSPLVELLVDLRPGDDRWSEEPPRARDAEQLAARIISLVGNEAISTGEHERRTLAYRDIALLFRAMTEVHIYESAFRRAGIPYVTVDGKGFYAREEVDDFIQLLRFLDNKTDEVALAAVLRSPICGLSDDTLLALRCAPLRAGVTEPERLQKHNAVRPLLEAVREHEFIDFIEGADRPALDKTRDLLEELIRRATRTGISELLRFAVDVSEYRTIAAATFDGAQRLANLEKLFTLAQRFSDTGANLIRDFVRFVRDFEETGGRESEGEVDESADAVRLMSIHQSKGLEFPVVIIPDLHRQPDNRRDWWALDRHLGLTLKVHDGRGRLVWGSTFTTLTERAKRREEFESMRLLYVAATRARDRLILSGAAKDLASLRNSWLDWLCKTFRIGSDSVTGLIRPEDGVELCLTLNLLDAQPATDAQDEVRAIKPDLLPPPDESFPLIGSILSERSATLHRFSITQLLNYRRCPRQYYFDRVLHAPSDEEAAVWNEAEAPEPPANLTATLRGAVMHRFCEKFVEGEDLHARLKTSFEDVLAQRIAELGDRISEIDSEKAIRDLLPLAKNYVGSRVRERIEAARALSNNGSAMKNAMLGVFSEQRFRLRRPLGILTGTIDKLVATPAANGEGVNVEIIDFKTNRFRGSRHSEVNGKAQRGQMAFDFLQTPAEAVAERDLLMQAEIEATAADYQVQMQAYALAARDLIPEALDVRVTLHFLSPDIEVCLPDELLGREACAVAIDETMEALVSSSLPASFAANPAEHCRVCDFIDLCSSGRQWVGNIK